MHFLKVGILFSASTVSRLLAGLVVVKIIAITIGAHGLGQLGQFMSLMSMITIIAGGGITNGIIKYVAEYKNDTQELNSYLGAASYVMLAASILIGVILFTFSERISYILFQNSNYSHVIKILSFAQFFIAINNLLLGILNAYKSVRAFAIINTLSSIIGPCGIALGCLVYGIEGAMYGLIWMPSCQIIFLVIWYKFGMKLDWGRLRPVLDLKRISSFLRFSLMLIVTVLTMQMSQIVIRSFIETNANWSDVGYWQATTKISDAYLQFITVVLGNYYLPRLAEANSRDEIFTEVKQAFKFVSPILISLIAIIFVFKKQIILILFSGNFSPVENFLPFQLVGDVFKIFAYLIGYVAVAKAKTKFYISAEIFQSSMLVVLSYCFIRQFGAVGATYAYASVYLCYFAIACFVFRQFLTKKQNNFLQE